jgi:hypothetical protein
MVWPLAFLFVLILACPVAAQTDSLPLASSSHTFSFSVGDAGANPAPLSMELRTRSSDSQIDAPAAVKFAPVDAGFLHDTAFTLTTAVGSKRDRGRWLVEIPHAFTLSMSRAFVTTQSVSVTIAPYTTVSAGRDECLGTSLSTWIGSKTSQLSVTAGVAQGRERDLSTKLYAGYGQTFSRALRGAANVTYAGGQGSNWMAASEGMSYRVMTGLELALSSRQETVDARLESSLNFDVSVRLGR